MLSSITTYKFHSDFYVHIIILIVCLTELSKIISIREPGIFNSPDMTLFWQFPYYFYPHTYSFLCKVSFDTLYYTLMFRFVKLNTLFHPIRSLISHFRASARAITISICALLISFALRSQALMVGRATPDNPDSSSCVSPHCLRMVFSLLSLRFKIPHF